MASRTYQICSRCIMDTSDPTITFDTDGVCNHCRIYDQLARKNLVSGSKGNAILQKKVEQMKKLGAGKKYDCIVGVSGGVDSTFIAYKAKELGLRPLAVHFDSGWNSELAVKNIEHIVKKLGIDLETFVVPWDEMRDLQLAYIKASVINADVPTDHAFFAALYRIASRHGIRTIITGHNIQTESLLPPSWIYDSRDLLNLEAIHKAYGKVPLKGYPRMGIWRRWYYQRLQRIENFRILYYLDYNREEAKQFIINELGWRDYGGKHHECIFTRFFQSYYLPKRFKIEKRRAHLSNLIVSGQLSRKEALAEIEKPSCPPDLIEMDRIFLAKKLGISDNEFNALMDQPTRSHSEFATYAQRYRLIYKLRDLFRTCRRMRGTWGGIVQIMVRSLSKGISAVVALPIAGLAILFGKAAEFIDRYASVTLLLAYIPGHLGEFTRLFFYRATLRKLGRNVVFKFGSYCQYTTAEIGSNVTIGLFNALGEVSIGSKVVIGGYVNFLSGLNQHSYSDEAQPITTQEALGRQRIRVGSDVWIGSNCVIASDIGSRTVIGAGSVVIKPTLDCAVYAGNPAQLVRKIRSMCSSNDGLIALAK